MSINYLVNGSTLQNELIQLLSKQYNDKENNVSNTDIKVDADNVKNILTKTKSKQKTSSKSNKVDLNNVIEKTIVKHDSDELRTVNPDLSGGCNILGLVENILAGGSLNDSVKNDVTNNNSPIEEGADVIHKILSDNKDTINGGTTKNNNSNHKVHDSYEPFTLKNNNIMAHSDNSDSDEDSDEDSDDSDEDSDDDIYDKNNDNGDIDDGDSYEPFGNNKYIKIIREMKELDDLNATKLTGGNVKSVERIKILNMFPWILKSSNDS